MKDSRIAARGLVLLGCGNMGSAMLAGWLERGLPATSVWVQDPAPSSWVQSTGVHVNADLPTDPAVILVAVKPQLMSDALPAFAAFGGGDTVFVSVAAGTPLSAFEEVFGIASPIVRAMPNTPSAVGRGITAICANDAGQGALDEADMLLSAVGDVVRLENEEQMDAVTGVSGSGPAYVFHLIETLAAGGVAQGLPEELAMQLAKATVAGAGHLAMEAAEHPAQLRVNVTSPNGTTQAALEVLMDENSGFPSLLPRAVKAASERSKELSLG
ncbi:pyrroline-5-carboxylate reductase [Tateyamaria omphalii]|uniref:pyrroline-5-carboxylate reductase n=1 Tax=Tateyamaria omphalii TaxID=299262 RepID=UPI001674B652|nr:pyrroline-5-carboxylate reductase [Tateyamaria omphalii]GGX54222.1 pyrroline-5-carboxylate reductase [Tateyamaria omphalii]